MAYGSSKSQMAKEKAETTNWSMNEERKSRFHLITPFQWVVGVIVAAVALSLTAALVRVPAKANPWALRYPRGVLVGGAGMTETFRTADSLTNVSLWYQAKLGLPPATGTPSFTFRSSSWFGAARNLQETGFMGPRPGTAVQSCVYMRKQREQVVLVHLSQHPGESNTCIQITQFQARTGGFTFAPVPAIAPLSPPRAMTASCATSVHMCLQTLTIRTNLSAVVQWYGRQFRGMGTRNGSFAVTNFVTSVSLPHARTNEMDWTYSTTNTLAVIHAEATGSNSTEVVIGAVAY